MTVVVAENGWLIISDGGSNSMELLYGKAEVNPVFDPIVNVYEGGSILSYDLGKFSLEFKFTNVWLTTDTNYENFLKYLKDWQQANTLTIAIKKTASTYIALEGTGYGTSFTVVCPAGGIQGAEKRGRGSDQTYVIGTLRFVKGG